MGRKTLLAEELVARSQGVGLVIDRVVDCDDPHLP
jgi:hypothetical protein